MKSESFFKFLFWFITALLIGIIAVGTTVFVDAVKNDPFFPSQMIIFFIFVFLIICAIFIAIPVFVYKDASARGMNRWMWVTLATYLPNLIGLIVYFIVRGNYGKKCVNCGQNVNLDFEVCPYCASPLNMTCKSCGKQVGSDWKVCPYCKNDL